jgi:hypothetical protein
MSRCLARQGFRRVSLGRFLLTKKHSRTTPWNAEPIRVSLMGSAEVPCRSPTLGTVNRDGKTQASLESYRRRRPKVF